MDTLGPPRALGRSYRLYPIQPVLDTDTPGPLIAYGPVWPGHGLLSATTGKKGLVFPARAADSDGMHTFATKLHFVDLETLETPPDSARNLALDRPYLEIYGVWGDEHGVHVYGRPLRRSGDGDYDYDDDDDEDGTFGREDDNESGRHCEFAVAGMHDLHIRLAFADPVPAAYSDGRWSFLQWDRVKLTSLAGITVFNTEIPTDSQRPASIAMNRDVVAVVGSDFVEIIQIDQSEFEEPYSCELSLPASTIQRFEATPGDVVACAVSRTRPVLAAGYDDGLLRLWNLHALEAPALELKFSGPIEFMVFGGTKDYERLYAAVNAGHIIAVNMSNFDLVEHIWLPQLILPTPHTSVYSARRQLWPENKKTYVLPPTDPSEIAGAAGPLRIIGLEWVDERGGLLVAGTKEGVFLIDDNKKSGTPLKTFSLA